MTTTPETEDQRIELDDDKRFEQAKAKFLEGNPSLIHLDDVALRMLNVGSEPTPY